MELFVLFAGNVLQGTINKLQYSHVDSYLLLSESAPDGGLVARIFFFSFWKVFLKCLKRFAAMTPE